MARPQHYYWIRIGSNPKEHIYRMEKATGPRTACKLAFGVIYDNPRSDTDCKYYDLGTRHPRYMSATRKREIQSTEVGWKRLPPGVAFTNGPKPAPPPAPVVPEPEEVEVQPQGTQPVPGPAVFVNPLEAESQSIVNRVLSAAKEVMPEVEAEVKAQSNPTSKPFSNYAERQVMDALANLNRYLAAIHAETLKEPLDWYQVYLAAREITAMARPRVTPFIPE